MVLDSLDGLTSSQKQELVASLSSLIVGSTSTDAGEISSESLIAVAQASGNELSPAWAALFANLLQKSAGIDKFCPAPGSGGGGGGGGDSGGAATEAVVEEEVVEEEEIDMGGGMDMFGGEEAGGGDY